MVAQGERRRKDKRIPKSSYGLVKELTENYRRFTALLRELNEAMVEAYLRKGGVTKFGHTLRLPAP